MAQDSFRTVLIRGTSGTFVLKVLNAGLLFAIGVVLARLLGAEQYGIYAYTLTIATFVAMPASKGWPQLLVRQVAKYKTLDEWSHLRGLIRWTRLSVFFLSMAVIGLSLLIIYGFPQFSENKYASTLSIALILVGVLPLVQINEAAIRGFSHPVSGVVSSQVIRPFLCLVLIGLAHWVISVQFNAELAMILQAGAFAGALFSSGLLLSGLMPVTVKANRALYETSPWIKSVIPLMCIGGLQVINTRVDLLMLGTIQGTMEAGIYHAVTRCSELVLFGTAAINLTFAPMVARLHANQERQLLQKLITRCTSAMLAFAVPVAVVLLLFKQQVLSLFGPGFVLGSSALVVLGLGQMIIAGLGPAGLILNMTGHERVTAFWVGITAACNLILNLILIPVLGLPGAAIATTFSMLLHNLFLVRQVSKILSLRTTVFNI
ncbi:MAG: flippase [Desulfohalobiaceae bacterium]|nr:flippase [Desulfohalobiaceae bacterium]